jgi:hypothetical protein
MHLQLSLVKAIRFREIKLPVDTICRHHLADCNGSNDSLHQSLGTISMGVLCKFLPIEAIDCILESDEHLFQSAAPLQRSQIGSEHSRRGCDPVEAKPQKQNLHLLINFRKNHNISLMKWLKTFTLQN